MDAAASARAEQLEQVRAGRGFFAALDQSGGSTPKALAEYGVDESRYQGDAQMFDLVHAMRTRIVTSPAFDGSRVLAAILFEQTMDRDVDGVPTGQFLWDRKHVVPFLKVDKGLADEAHGVQLMKPIDTLDDLLARATAHGMFGTKMRSVIKDADPDGVRAVVDQQFEVAARISAAGLVPILEPEVSIDSPHKNEAEALLHDAVRARIDALPADATIMLKLTIPTQPGRYADLAADPRVLQVLALSGGYSRDEACTLLAEDPVMIASFSRALLEGLSDGQSDEQFNDRLEASVAQIFAASVTKNRRFMSQAEWDERYGAAEQVWSGQPNGALVTETAGLRPGRVLDVGCGEGADAVWLAQQGWQVTALDVSQVALDRAAAAAAGAGVAVTWLHSELVGADLPPGGFDLVSAQYPALRKTPDHDAERALLDAVAAGGTLLVVHHAHFDHSHAEHLDFDPADYVNPADVAELLDDTWTVTLEQERPRHVASGAGAGHTHDVVLRATRRP